MDRTKVRYLREVLKQALEEFGEKENLVVDLGSATFGNSNVTFKLNLNEVSGDGSVLTREAVAFQRAARLYGLQPEDLGRVFRSPSGKRFKITGLNTRAHKYPIQAEEVGTGKRFKFPSHAVVGNFIDAA